MTWWDEEKEEFYTMYPSLTKAKQMFVRRNRISAIHEVRSKERMEKYLCRGFTVVDEPPPFWFTPDERGEEDVAVWGEVQAFDVLAYEEKNAKEHLRMGDWFVLIGCGETWYAYDRRPLITYMEEHGGVHAGERGLLYDTPYRQTVIHEAWDAFAYSDYSVYELVEPEVISVRVKGREETKTLYGVRAYSVAEWRAGEAGYVVGKQTEARREEEKEEAVAEEDVAEEAGEGLLDALQGLLAEEEVIPDSPPLPDDIASVLVVSTEEFYRQLLNWIQVDRR
jgi:NACalpha-BTF3-like transcription factor